MTEPQDNSTTSSTEYAAGDVGAFAATAEVGATIAG